MKKLPTIPRWLSIVVVAGYVVVFIVCDWAEDILGSSWIVVYVFNRAMLALGIALIWIPYVVDTKGLTSTWRDAFDESVLRFIGWIILLTPFFILLMALLYRKSQDTM